MGNRAPALARPKDEDALEIYIDAHVDEKGSARITIKYRPIWTFYGPDNKISYLRIILFFVVIAAVVVALTGLAIGDDTLVKYSLLGAPGGNIFKVIQKYLEVLAGKKAATDAKAEGDASTGISRGAQYAKTKAAGEKGISACKELIKSTKFIRRAVVESGNADIRYIAGVESLYVKFETASALLRAYLEEEIALEDICEIPWPKDSAIIAIEKFLKIFDTAMVECVTFKARAAPTVAVFDKIVNGLEQVIQGIDTSLPAYWVITKLSWSSIYGFLVRDKEGDYSMMRLLWVISSALGLIIIIVGGLRHNQPLIGVGVATFVAAMAALGVQKEYLEKVFGKPPEERQANGAMAV